MRGECLGACAREWVHVFARARAQVSVLTRERARVRYFGMRWSATDVSIAAFSAWLASDATCRVAARRYALQRGGTRCNAEDALQRGGAVRVAHAAVRVVLVPRRSRAARTRPRAGRPSGGRRGADDGSSRGPNRMQVDKLGVVVTRLRRDRPGIGAAGAGSRCGGCGGIVHSVGPMARRHCRKRGLPATGFRVRVEG